MKYARLVLQFDQTRFNTPRRGGGYVCSPRYLSVDSSFPGPDGMSAVAVSPRVGQFYVICKPGVS